MVQEKASKRVLAFDIESTGLDADFGTLLCVGYKWLGENKVHVVSVLDTPAFKKDPTNDKYVVKEFLKVYKEADVALTYNGILFDRPYILAKTLAYGLEVPPNVPMIDLYFTVKSNLRISRKNLWTVQKFLNLENSKSGVDGKIWRRAAVGHEPSIKWIVKHCKDDVKVLEEAYLKLRPLVRTHYRLSRDLGHCRYCDSSRLQSRGTSVTKNKGPVRRIQCQDCSGWDTRSVNEVKKFGLKERKNG